MDTVDKIESLISTRNPRAIVVDNLGAFSFDLAKRGGALLDIAGPYSGPALCEDGTTVQVDSVRPVHVMGGVAVIDARDLAMADVVRKAAEAATKIALRLGTDATQAISDITTAIVCNSPLCLDDLGVIVKVSEAQEKYAANIGKSVDALTEEEKTLAFREATMKALLKSANEIA